MVYFEENQKKLFTRTKTYTDNVKMVIMLLDTIIICYYRHYLSNEKISIVILWFLLWMTHSLAVYKNNIIIII